MNDAFALIKFFMRHFFCVHHMCLSKCVYVRRITKKAKIYMSVCRLIDLMCKNFLSLLNEEINHTRVYFCTHSQGCQCSHKLKLTFAAFFSSKKKQSKIHQMRSRFVYKKTLRKKFLSSLNIYCRCFGVSHGECG